VLVLRRVAGEAVFMAVQPSRIVRRLGPGGPDELDSVDSALVVEAFTLRPELEASRFLLLTCISLKLSTSSSSPPGACLFRLLPCISLFEATAACMPFLL
jgi:hypothetical protein